MRKVYILNNAGHDYSDAARFGELVFLDVPEGGKWDIGFLYESLHTLLIDAEEDDLLLLSSLTSHCCVATAILTEWYGRVNFLIFRKDKYEEKKLFTKDQEPRFTEVGELGN